MWENEEGGGVAAESSFKPEKMQPETELEGSEASRHT